MCHCKEHFYAVPLKEKIKSQKEKRKVLKYIQRFKDGIHDIIKEVLITNSNNLKSKWNCLRFLYICMNQHNFYCRSMKVSL